MIEHYAATLIGCAVGDTLGMPVEAMTREQIRKYTGGITHPIDPVIIMKDGIRMKEDEFGALKGWTRDLRKGMYTDDTILTLAIAESIIEHGLDVQKVAECQLAAYHARPYIEEGRRSGAFGGTTLAGFHNLEQGDSALNSGVIGGPGNAPAMKMSPVGLYAAATGNLEEALQFAEAVGRITHLDPRSIASGVAQAYAIKEAVLNQDRLSFIDKVVQLCSTYEKPVTRAYSLWEQGSLTSRICWINHNIDTSADNAFGILGNSSVVMQSYPFALFMFLKYWDDPITGLLATVNYGGDCDTTGAIFGALAGARHGMIFPQKWLDVLQDRDRLINAGELLFGGGE